ncbi:aldehyde dehydrogenase [Nocardioides sp. J54]|uniref:aldehyde dehydrogenase n=1 Tax=Nocardioides sp. J54 TaxID=935866 RepID=UPI00048DC8E2|nr:aldehyde dehydrogenase [Nocardioides sp. J54]
MQQLWMGGRWQSARDGGTTTVVNPADLTELAEIQVAGVGDMERAIGMARSTFDDGVWRNQPPEKRAAVLRGAADHIEARIPELARLLTSELGCPIWFSEKAHVPNPVRHLRYYADLIENTPLEEARTDGVNRSLVVDEPVGVVGAITPWNGPLSSPTIKVAPALAAGCSVVVKPATLTPMTIMALGEAFAEAGLPEGVLSILPADREAGNLLIRHPEVDKIGFTGSTEVGKMIARTAADRVGRVTLELGGKSAAIVLRGADVDAMVTALLPMAFSVNGQLCISQSRVLVPRDMEDDVRDALAAAIAALKVGDPLDPATFIGPLVSQQQRDTVLGYLDVARAEGADVAVGGGAAPAAGPGWYVEPTLLAGVTNAMRVAQEEIFGPVMSLITYDDVEDAVKIANDSPYGLSGSVWGSDPEVALGVARQVRTGMVSINGAPQSWGTPFGGFKQSGIGREMGPEGLQSYLEKKSIALPAGTVVA